MAGGWCTIAQVSLSYNTTEVTDFGDDNKDGSADTGVVQHCIDAAADHIWSIIYPHYSDTTAMAPGTYTAGDGTYRVLESMNATLAIDYLKHRQGGGGEEDFVVTEDNPTIRWAYRVAEGNIDIPGATRNS